MSRPARFLKALHCDASHDDAPALRELLDRSIRGGGEQKATDTQGCDVPQNPTADLPAPAQLGDAA